MRYSPVQENIFGDGSEQETPQKNVNSIMDATGDIESAGINPLEEGSMISNLPLLFASGYPTSLEKVTMMELERFVSFMVQCSLGHDTTDVISQPPWWPKDVKFSVPVERPKKSPDNWIDTLKMIVLRCYNYHKSDYLLRFCSYLAQYPHEKLEYVNNYDSTTSLYLKTTGKLLVTFRNENMNYDRKLENPRKKLLVSNKSNKNYHNEKKSLRRRSAQKQAPSPAMVEQAADDIYLCDNCDDEFVGLKQMKEHEKLCYRVEPRPVTPENDCVAPVLEQDQFLEYFSLMSSTDTGVNKTVKGSPFKENISKNRNSARLRTAPNLTRCPAIPLSSPAGMALVKKSKLMSEESQQERLDRIERHLVAPPLCSSSIPKWMTRVSHYDRWSVTFKPSRDRLTKNSYVHHYKFNNFSKKPALDIPSQLMYLSCKPIYVLVARLTDEDLDDLRQHPARYKTPEPQIKTLRAISPVAPVPTRVNSFNLEQRKKIAPSPIIIDLDDEDDDSDALNCKVNALPTLPTPVPETVFPVFNHQSPPKPGPVKRQKTSAKPVIYVDLCSSDEEDGNSSINRNPSVNLADENRDPLRKLPEVRIEPHFLSELSGNKFFTKPFGYATSDPRITWFPKRSVDGETNTAPKRESILKNCTIPIL